MRNIFTMVVGLVVGTGCISVRVPDKIDLFGQKQGSQNPLEEVMWDHCSRRIELDRAGTPYNVRYFKHSLENDRVRNAEYNLLDGPYQRVRLELWDQKTGEHQRAELFVSHSNPEKELEVHASQWDAQGQLEESDYVLTEERGKVQFHFFADLLKGDYAVLPESMEGLSANPCRYQDQFRQGWVSISLIDGSGDVIEVSQNSTRIKIFRFYRHAMSVVQAPDLLP